MYHISQYNQLYLINLYHPPCNVDDNAKDDLSDFIVLPKLEFYEYKDPIIDKWKAKQIEHLIDTAPLDYSDEAFWI